MNTQTQNKDSGQTKKNLLPDEIMKNKVLLNVKVGTAIINEKTDEVMKDKVLSKVKVGTAMINRLGRKDD